MIPLSWWLTGIAIVFLACGFGRRLRTVQAPVLPERWRPFSIPMVHWVSGAPVCADGVAEWWTPRFGIEAERLGLYDAERMHAYLMAVEPVMLRLSHQGSRKESR